MAKNKTGKTLDITGGLPETAWESADRLAIRAIQYEISRPRKQPTDGIEIMQDIAQVIEERDAIYAYVDDNR